MRYSVSGSTVDSLRSIGATNIVFPRHVDVVFADLTDRQVEVLQSRGCTVRPVLDTTPLQVTPPKPVAAAPTYSAQDLAIRLGYDELRNITSPPCYGTGVCLAIIDTGIRETHELIGGRVVHTKNFTDSPDGDGFNHGTGVASVAVSLAPEMNILDLKAINDNGKGTEEQLTLALDHCLDLIDEDSQYAPNVINLSIGSTDQGDPNNPVRVACRQLIDRGVWVIAAAGNSGPQSQTVTCPACEKYVGAVGSCAYDPFTVSEFSSRGPTQEGIIKPDMVMVGQDIVTASSDSDSATSAKSGTSFASPFVSAIGVLAYEAISKQVQYESIGGLPGGTAGQAGNINVRSIEDRWLPMMCVKPEGEQPGKDADYGYGIPLPSAMRQLLEESASAAAGGTVFTVMIGMMFIIMMFNVIQGIQDGSRKTESRAAKT